MVLVGRRPDQAEENRVGSARAADRFLEIESTTRTRSTPTAELGNDADRDDPNKTATLTREFGEERVDFSASHLIRAFFLSEVAMAPADVVRARKLLDAGELSSHDIAAMLKVSRVTMFRELRKARGLQ